MDQNLINLFHHEADNVGDRMCGPAQYLWPSDFKNASLNACKSISFKMAIVGGGQVFEQLRRISEKKKTESPDVKLVAWAIGLPLRGSRDKEVLEVAEQCELLSTRNYDWRDVLPFVPCASCLSPLFDDKIEPQHEVVVYLHRRKQGPNGIPDEFPTLSNGATSPRTAIQFIASGDTVVTNSYHGVYWAQLLGRRVVCIPYNHKFFTFENPPTMADRSDWLSALTSAKRSRPLLEEYRFINASFAARVETVRNA